MKNPNTPKTKKEVEAIVENIVKDVYSQVAGDYDFDAKKYVDQIMALLNPVEKKYENFLSDCCGAEFNPWGFLREDGLYDQQCLKCGKRCNPVWRKAPSPNEAPKGEAIEINENSTQEDKDKLKQQIGEPPAPDKEFEGIRMATEAQELVSDAIQPLLNIAEGKRPLDDWNDVMDKIMDVVQSCVSKEADRRVEEVIGEIENIFHEHMFSDRKTIRIKDWEALKKKLSLPHKEEEK